MNDRCICSRSSRRGRSRRWWWTRRISRGSEPHDADPSIRCTVWPGLDVAHVASSGATAMGACRSTAGRIPGTAGRRRTPRKRQAPAGGGGPAQPTPGAFGIPTNTTASRGRRVVGSRPAGQHVRTSGAGRRPGEGPGWEGRSAAGSGDATHVQEAGDPPGEWPAPPRPSVRIFLLRFVEHRDALLGEVVEGQLAVAEEILCGEG